MLTDEELREIRHEHREATAWGGELQGRCAAAENDACQWYDSTYPCKVIRLLDDIERLRRLDPALQRLATHGEGGYCSGCENCGVTAAVVAEMLGIPPTT